MTTHVKNQKTPGKVLFPSSLGRGDRVLAGLAPLCHMAPGLAGTLPLLQPSRAGLVAAGQGEGRREGPNPARSGPSSC